MQVVELVKVLDKIDIVVAKPEKERIRVILEKTGMSRENLRCSVCNCDLSDLTKIRAIFPYHSALICCNKIECLLACRDKLISERPE